MLRLTPAGAPDPGFGAAGFAAGYRIRLQEGAALADDAVVAGAVQPPSWAA